LDKAAAIFTLLFGKIVFFAIEVARLAGRANWENGDKLASASWSYKVHFTRLNRSGEVSYLVEGERKGTYPDGEHPAWVIYYFPV